MTSYREKSFSFQKNRAPKTTTAAKTSEEKQETG